MSDINKEQILRAKEEIRKEAYDLWIVHPTTQQFIKNLEKHRISFLAKMEANTSNPSMTDAMFRQWTSNAKTISTIINCIKDYTLFNQSNIPNE